MFLPMPIAEPQAIALPVLRSGPLVPDFRAAMNEGGAASVKVKITVSTEGRPVRCDIAFANGPEANGERLCAMVLEKARYAPALDQDGKPIAGIAFFWSQWSKGRWLGSAPPQWDPVDLALEVNKIPAGFREMGSFHLRIVTDPAGRLQACEVEETRLAAQAKALLCRETASETIPPALDAKGAAMASVRPVRVRLVSGAFDRKLMRRLRGR
ncbi:MAG: hypothetical protein QOJ91_2502 [Sphingomonadales bacterium]|nr:hypothetical protein [Sphingomonadales bacterium]